MKTIKRTEEITKLGEVAEQAETRGRKKILETADDLYNLFVAYKMEVKESPILVHDYVGKDAAEVSRKKERPLTIEGFENHVASIEGMPTALQQYFENRDGRYDDFVSVCTRIKRIIRQDQIEGGMAGIYNPSITQRLNSLADKIEAKVETTDPDEIDYDKLSDAALEEIVNARRK
jgi:hypothetical protein